VLIIAGTHVPVIAGKLVDAAGNGGAGAPWQSGPIALNVGVIKLVIVMLMVVVDEHCPGLGVKVYTVVPTTAVLITAGAQVPVIAGKLVDDAGNAGATLP
jgi:hypothetical protein